MTVLAIIQDAAAELAIPLPTAVVSSTDAQVRQLLRLFYIEGRDLLDAHDWQRLLTTRTFTSLSTEAQTGEPVSAFYRMAHGVEMWNTTNDWEITGPLSPSDWARLTVQQITSVPQFWRLQGGVLQVYSPTAGDSIRYEYISKNWVTIAADSSLAETAAADSDTILFPEPLVVKGMVWRWKQTKGLEYAEDMRSYELYKMARIAQDRGGTKSYSTERFDVNRPFKTWPGRITA